jgi:hypothetical protein
VGGRRGAYRFLVGENITLGERDIDRSIILKLILRHYGSGVDYVDVA